MLTKADFRSIIRKRGGLVIDGGLATQLEANGHDLNHPLWSGKLLKEDPDAIQKVHLDYYLAGADVAITASYQASTQGLQDHLGVDDDAATQLIKRSVHLAQRARCDAYQKGRGGENTDDKLLIAGSVGPYGAFLADGSEYSGAYGSKLTAEEYRRFHHPRLKALIDAGVDLLAIETIPCLDELEAIKTMLKADFPDAIAWVSCTLKDAQHISDGTDIKAILPPMLESEQVVAFGVNCVPITIVTAALNNLKHLLETTSEAEQSNGAGEARELQLICYPNSGETYDAEKKVWVGKSAEEQLKDVMERVQYWAQAGATLIGGCCRTGPDYVKAVARVLRGD